MHPVAKINIPAARRIKHRTISKSWSHTTMAGKILRPYIGLCFEDTVFFLMLIGPLDDKPTT
jgi:hypothetical protein